MIFSFAKNAKCFLLNILIKYIAQTARIPPMIVCKLGISFNIIPDEINAKNGTNSVKDADLVMPSTSMPL